MPIRTIPNRDELKAARAEQLLPRVDVLWDRDRQVTHFSECGAVHENISVLDLHLDFECEGCAEAPLAGEVHRVVRSLMAAKEWLGKDLEELVTHEVAVDQVLRVRLWTEEDLVELGEALRLAERLQDETAEGLELLPGLEDLAQQVRERAAFLEEEVRTSLGSEEVREVLREVLDGIPEGPGLDDADLLLMADPNTYDDNTSAIPGALVIVPGRVTVDGNKKQREAAALTGYPYVALKAAGIPSETLTRAAELWEPYGSGPYSKGTSLLRAAEILTGNATD